MRITNQEELSSFSHNNQVVNAYVYKITSRTTGQFYIGYRYRNQTLGVEPKDDLWARYFTSSKYVKELIKENGKQDFVFEILFESLDSLKCWELEQDLISQNWNNELILNRKYMDKTTRVEFHRRLAVVSDETRKKMSMAGKGRKKTMEHREKIRESNMGQKRSEEFRKHMSYIRTGCAAHNKGKSPPNVTCDLCGKTMSNANYRKWHLPDCRSSQTDLVMEYIRENGSITGQEALEKLNIRHLSSILARENIDIKKTVIKGRTLQYSLPD